MQRRSFIQAILAAALFGIATPFSKTLLADIQANQLAGLLYLGAALCLLPIVVRRHRTGAQVFPRDFRNRRNLLAAIFFGGMVGPVLLLVGLRHASAASVSMWLNLETVATAVLARFLFKEDLGRWTWLGNLGIVFAGLLLSTNEGWAGWIGLFCVSGAAVAWGLDNNFTAVIDGISPEDSTFWKGLVAGLTNLVIGMVLFPWRISPAWIAAIALGGVSYGASVALYIRAAQGVGATRAQMVFASAPFFGVLLSILWLGEPLSRMQGGAALVLAASVGLMLFDRHEHRHLHKTVSHDHEHRHDDLHHDHKHGSPLDAAHSHLHDHRPQTHSHPHWPDLHHRHEH